MDSLFIFLFGILAAIIAGLFIGFVLVSLANIIIKFWLGRKIPSKEEMLDGGKEFKLTKKEVEDIDRDKFGKYRQFEKYRRIATGKSESKRSPIAERIAGEIERSGLLQSDSDKPIKLNSPTD